MTATRARMCGTKKPMTKAEAAALIRRLVGQGAAPGLMNKYRCTVCLSWHIGHTPRRKARAGSRKGSR